MSVSQVLLAICVMSAIGAAFLTIGTFAYALIMWPLKYRRLVPKPEPLLHSAPLNAKEPAQKLSPAALFLTTTAIVILLLMVGFVISRTLSRLVTINLSLASVFWSFLSVIWAMRAARQYFPRMVRVVAITIPALPIIVLTQLVGTTFAKSGSWTEPTVWLHGGVLVGFPIAVVFLPDLWRSLQQSSHDQDTTP